MEWHGERLLPRGLPELTYELVPRWIARDLKVITHPRGEKRGVGGWVGKRGGWWVIHLFPTVICRHAGGHHGFTGTERFNFWYAFLRTTLHEIGHVETWRVWPWAPAGTYEAGQLRWDDSVASRYYRHIERLADEWASRTIERIGRRDARLGQPTRWIGGLPGIYILKATKRWGTFWHWTLREDFRASQCGGQLAARHVLTWAWGQGPAMYLLQRCSVRRLHRLLAQEAAALGLGRYWLDGAGRRHPFFTYAEAAAVVDRLQPRLTAYRHARTPQAG